MKRHKLPCILNVLVLCLPSVLVVQANDIPLEELVGWYQPKFRSWADVDKPAISVSVEANRLIIVKTAADAFTATYKNNVLTVDFDKGLAKRADEKSPDSWRYLSVRWGRLIYLIPKPAVEKFCDAVNAGIEPKDSPPEFSYYLKSAGLQRKDASSDSAVPMNSDPDLPAEYRNLLLKKAVEGKVTEISERREAWVNFDPDSGIRPGMKLRGHMISGQSPKLPWWLDGLDRNTYYVTVLKVEGDHCLVEGRDLTVGTLITSRRWD